MRTKKRQRDLADITEEHKIFTQFMRVLSGWTDLAIREELITMTEVRNKARTIMKKIDAKTQAREVDSVAGGDK